MVVQLVRIPACHAGGRGFESRPYRKKDAIKCILFCFKIPSYSLHKKIEPYLPIRLDSFLTQTQNKTRQNYFMLSEHQLMLEKHHVHYKTIPIELNDCLVPNFKLQQKDWRNVHDTINSPQDFVYQLFYLCSLSLFCQFHADNSVSSILVSAFHPKIVLARLESAHTCSISPNRRPSI